MSERKEPITMVSTGATSQNDAIPIPKTEHNITNITNITTQDLGPIDVISAVRLPHEVGLYFERIAKAHNEKVASVIRKQLTADYLASRSPEAPWYPKTAVMLIEQDNASDSDFNISEEMKELNTTVKYLKKCVYDQTFDKLFDKPSISITRINSLLKKKLPAETRKDLESMKAWFERIMKDPHNGELLEEIYHEYSKQ